MHVQEGIYHKELAHIMMDAEKSHDLLSTCWRPRKASGVAQFESKGLRTKSVKQEKICVPIKQSGRKTWILSSAFCSIWAPTDWLTPTSTEEGKLLIASTDSSANFFPKHSPRNNV